MNRFLAPSLSALALGVLVTVGEAQKPAMRAADEAAVRAADQEWLKAVRARDPERIASLYAGNAYLVRVDETVVVGRTGIRAEWSRIFAIAGFTHDAQMARVEITREGQAHSNGIYEAAMLGDRKQKVTVGGWRTVYWNRDRDGSWKIAFEIYTEDSPYLQP